MKPDSLIFDIDGTLWDATGVLAEAYSEASLSFPFGEKHFTKERLKKELGLPLKVIFSHLYPELEAIRARDPEGAERMLERLNELSTACEYRRLKEYGAPVFAGVPETLKSLAARYPLFIVSNCEKGYIEIMTESAGIGPYFKDWLCFGDTLQEKDVTMRILMERHGLRRPAYIGDIRNDALSARRAGAAFIWAAYGFGEVEPGLYDERIDDFRELTKLL